MAGFRTGPPVAGPFGEADTIEQNAETSRIIAMVERVAFIIIHVVCVAAGAGVTIFTVRLIVCINGRPGCHFDSVQVMSSRIRRVVMATIAGRTTRGKESTTGIIMRGMTGIEAIGADDVLAVVTAALDIVMVDGVAQEVAVYRAITVTDRTDIIGVDLNGRATGAVVVVVLIVRVSTDAGKVAVVGEENIRGPELTKGIVMFVLCNPIFPDHLDIGLFTMNVVASHALLATVCLYIQAAKTGGSAGRVPG